MRPQPNTPASTEVFATNGGGRRSESLKALYHLVVTRHSRLGLLIRMRAPGIVIRNERRMLRAAVGAVVEESRAVGFANPDATREPVDSSERGAVAAHQENTRADLARVGLSAAGGLTRDFRP